MCDGSSILSTQGSRRFRVLQRGERDGYDVANVQLLEDEPTPPERLAGKTQGGAAGCRLSVGPIRLCFCPSCSP